MVHLTPVNTHSHITDSIQSHDTPHACKYTHSHITDSFQSHGTPHACKYT